MCKMYIFYLYFVIFLYHFPPPCSASGPLIAGHCETLDLTMRMPTLNVEPHNLFPFPFPSEDDATITTQYPNNSDYLTTMMVSSKYTEVSGTAAGKESTWDLVKVATVLDFSEGREAGGFTITKKVVGNKLKAMGKSYDQLRSSRDVLIIYTGWAKKLRTDAYLNYDSYSWYDDAINGTKTFKFSGFPVVASDFALKISDLQVGLMIDFPSLDAWPSNFKSTQDIFLRGQNPFIVNLNMTSYPENPENIIVFFYPVKQTENVFSPVRVIAIGFRKQDPCRYGARTGKLVCSDGKGSWPISGIVGLALFPTLLIVVCLIIKLQTWRQQHGFI